MSFQRERVFVPISDCEISADGSIAVDASVWMTHHDLGLERGRRPEPSPTPCISPAVPPENRGGIIKGKTPRPR